VAYITTLAGSGTLGYFADGNGNPKLGLADNPWGLIPNAGRWSGTWQSTLDAYFGARGTQGFNAIYLAPYGNTENGGAFNDGRTFDGVYPFNSGATNDPSSGLNDTYFARVDYALAAAAANGITIFLNIGYSGGPADMDTTGCLAGKTTQQYTDYGGFLAARYATADNLMWVVGNDYFDTFQTAYTAMKTGLRNGGANQPFMVHNMPESTSRKEFARQDTGCGTTNLSATVTDVNVAASDVGATVTGTGIPANSVINSVNPGVSFVMNNQATATGSVTLTILDFTQNTGTALSEVNFCYTYNAGYFAIEKAYTEASPLPVIAGDGYFYASSSNSYDPSLDRAARQEVWWALASGARYYNFGSEGIWQWDTNAAAQTTGEYFYTTQAGLIRTAVEGLPGFHKLIPDTSNLLVTAGRGTRVTTFLSGGGHGQYEPAFTNTYVAASRVADGTLALIYMPTATTITIDQSKMAAGYGAKWMDPLTCVTTAATVGSTYNSTAKGNNSAGQADWVLVLASPPYATWTVP